jgi:microcystin-dependent protein
MAENFNLIFGQNASQQYAWNDVDYQNGWETIGNIPPTAAQFDALQRRADTKAQELNSRLVNVEQSIAGGGSQKREPDTEYTVGTILTYDDLPMDWVLECIVGGISSANDITIPSPRVEGARILDGTVTWALRKIATYGGVGYRQSSTACPTGSIAYSTSLPAGWYLECTTPGTTSASDLVITSPSVGDTVTDGTVVWTIDKIGAGGSSGGGTPTGTILAYASNGALPDGYLACDGSAVSRTTYTDLFAVIGTTWGSGDGSTTFNLPNLNGYWVKGSSTAGSSISAGLPDISPLVNKDSVKGQGITITAKSGHIQISNHSIGAYGTSSGYSQTALVGANLSGNTNLGTPSEIVSSNSIYGASSTVSVSSKTVRFIIKY